MGESSRGTSTPESRRQDLIYMLSNAVEKQPAFDCATPNGSKFFMATSGDSGKKLGYLILAEELTERLNPDVWAWLGSVAGVIASSEDSELLIYYDRTELVRAWGELNRISGVRMSADDEETLDAWLERMGEYDDEDADEDE